MIKEIHTKTWFKYINFGYAIFKSKVSTANMIKPHSSIVIYNKATLKKILTFSFSFLSTKNKDNNVKNTSNY
jgi:hypothetical protein